MMKHLAGIIAVILLAMTVGSLPASSQNTKKQEAKREKLQREIAILDGQIKANATKSANALNQLALIRTFFLNQYSTVKHSGSPSGHIVRLLRPPGPGSLQEP